MNTAENKGFDADSFYRALESTAQARSKNWKQVGIETGVSASTLTRMAQGRKPDAASLAVLSAWAGLNPSDFVDGPYNKAGVEAEPIAQISTLLRKDPNLDKRSAEALEIIIKTAYQQLKSK